MILIKELIKITRGSRGGMAGLGEVAHGQEGHGQKGGCGLGSQPEEEREERGCRRPEVVPRWRVVDPLGSARRERGRERGLGFEGRREKWDLC